MANSRVKLERSKLKDRRDSDHPGDRSKEVLQFKDKLGLPNWQDLSKEIDQAAERHGTPWSIELKERIDIYRKYVDMMTTTMYAVKGAGVDVHNAFYNMVDLQAKLFALEEKLKQDGISPLESAEWMRARELLAKELQFIHKQGLDTARFHHEVEKAKRKTDDDTLFTIVGSEEQDA